MKYRISKYIFICIFITGLKQKISSQNLLNKNIPSLEINRQRLAEVLEILSNKGNFYFSYNSSIIKKDSLVTLTVYNKSVKQILDFLFKANYEYKESGNYLIIRRSAIQFTLITNQAVAEDKFYAVTGYVLDDLTGETLSDASIYEKQRLISTLTDQKGFFKIKLKSKYKTAALTVSKQYYEDTTVNINPKYDQEITITITPLEDENKMITVSPEDYITPDSIAIVSENDSALIQYAYGSTDSIKVERTLVGKFLLSTKQKIQSVNLGKFFVARPYQVSFVPRLSTNGKLNGQVINKVSVNALGGYSGGVNGVEVGGLFNINKKNMQYFQAGGLFNLVGGTVKGVQIAGIHNHVLDSVTGLQIAGISNFVKGNTSGWQVAGIHNYASETMNGVQFAGIVNFANKSITGLQLAGIGNFSRREIFGTQVAGIFNYATKIKGAQIGLINIADSLDGFSIGLLNLSRNGYHKISFFANDLLNTNITIKTGNARLYSMLLGGVNISGSAKLYSFGFGLGHDIRFSKKASMSAELSGQYLYRGNWDHFNILTKFNCNFNWQLNKYLGLFAGPAVNIYYNDQNFASSAGYKKTIPLPGYKPFRVTTNANGWIGWNVGMTLF